MTPFIRIDRLLYAIPHLSSIRWILTGILLCGGLLLTPSDSPAKKPNKSAANPLELTEADRTFIELREASRKNDPARAQQLAASLPNYVFGDYVEYYKIKPQLFDAGGVARADTNADSQVTGFLNKYEGTALADRMRNDWLLELGRRRDWKNFAVDHSSYQMRDDRDVACYALLVEHLNGRNVIDQARSAWLAQRDGDEGCHLLASTLLDAKQFKPADAWLKLRLSVEALRPRGLLVGRLEARATAPLAASRERQMAFDPGIEGIAIPYTAAALAYYASVGLPSDLRYEVLSGDAHKAWNWQRGSAADSGDPAGFTTTSDDLARAMRRNPHMKVLVASGRYDLGTPYSATDWTLAQLDAPPEVLARVQHRYYDAGHMMYTRQADLAQLHADLGAWLA